MIPRLCSAAFAFGLLVLAGCGPAKLDITKNYVIDGQPEILLLDPQPKPQKITVEFTSDSAEVTVLLMKRSDCPNNDEAFTVPTSKAIASKREKSGTITGDLPEKTEGMVITRGGTKTNVKIHVTNK